MNAETTDRRAVTVRGDPLAEMVLEVAGDLGDRKGRGISVEFLGDRRGEDGPCHRSQVSLRSGVSCLS